jgi:hypothetical protein
LDAVLQFFGFLIFREAETKPILMTLFFFKKEPKTLALRGLNTLAFYSPANRNQGVWGWPQKNKSNPLFDGIVLFKKEPKTLALRGFNSLDRYCSF